MAKHNKKQVEEFYKDRGWRATISEFRIAPKDLSKLLGKGKNKSSDDDDDEEEEEAPKAKKKPKKKGGKKKAKAKAKKAAKENPQEDVGAIIDELSAGLAKLKTALAA